MQEETFRKREEALKQRDLELQESLIRFSKFLQENDSKRARAEKKAADEARARQAKEVEITKLTEELEALAAEKERVDNVVDRRMRCARGAKTPPWMLCCVCVCGLRTVGGLVVRVRAARTGHVGGRNGGRQVYIATACGGILSGVRPSNPHINIDRYQRYLESVLEVADEYQEIGELLTRHATLQATNHDLAEHMARCNEGAEAARKELAEYTKRRSDEVLMLNNRLAQLRQELEELEQEARLQEAAKDGSLLAASQRMLEHGQVVLATDNLFNLCKQHSSIAHPDHDDPLQQLEVIGNFISDLTVAVGQQHQSGTTVVPGQAAMAAAQSQQAV